MRTTYIRAFLIAFLWAAVVAFAAACTAPRAGRSAPAIAFNADRYPTLLEALQRERPHLLATRGGPALVLIVNGGMPEPIGNLAQIPTAWVIRVERLSSDPSQVGSIATLRVTLRK